MEDPRASRTSSSYSQPRSFQMNTFVATESEQDIKPEDFGKSMVSAQLEGSIIESPKKPQFIENVRKSKESLDPKIGKTKENQCHWCKSSFGFFVKKNRTNCTQCGYSVCG